MRKNVGYFEGTSAALLTDLVCEGFDTIPVSNGYDNHGMHVRIINNENKMDLLVGYVHKVFAPDDTLEVGGVGHEDVFHVCRTFDVPLLLLVHTDVNEKARALFGEVPENVYFLDPSDALAKARELLA
ncbi:MAG: hypothetical protein ABFS21_07300 [Actinomycetota bacterium]